MRSMLAWMCAGSLAAAATDPVAKEWQKGDTPPLPYRWHQPGSPEAGKHYPLVLFLHGAGERGTDNAAQLKHGVRDILRWSDANQQPCFLLAPQCPADRWWCDIDRETWQPAKTGNPNPVMQQVLALLDDILANHPVDPDRIYVTGISMGGFGTWSLLAAIPERIAAAIPICGGGNPDSAPRFQQVPLWVFHGIADDVVPVRTSRVMIEALQKAGAAPKFTEYPDVRHDSWTQTYRNPEVLRWLFDQRKPSPASPPDKP